MVFGKTVDGWKAGEPLTMGDDAQGYPRASLKDVPPGDYTIQAVLNIYETFHRSDGKTVKLAPDRGEGQHWNLAPGNLLSKPRLVHIGPGAPAIALSLDDVIPPIKPEPDTKYLRHIRIQSKLLTKFWGRPVFLSAIVLVPEGFDTHPQAHYPLIIFHDHFVTGFNDFRETPPDPDLKPDYSERFHLAGYNRIQQEEAYKNYKAWIAPGTPRMLIVKLQHANPYYDDSYAVNSANLGPYGDAIETELVPAIERAISRHRPGMGAVRLRRVDRRLGVAGRADVLSRSLQRRVRRLPRPSGLSCLHDSGSVQAGQHVLHCRARTRTWSSPPCAIISGTH